MLKAIIFDMDGVLIDSHGAHRAAWRSFNEAVNHPVTEQELDFVLDGRKREEILFHFLGELSPEQLQEYGRLKDTFFQQQVDDITVLPGLRPFLEELSRAGVRLGVATSANAQRTKNMLARLQLEEFFQVVVTGTEVDNGKPDPAVFLLTAARLGVSPREVLVIEDAIAGIQGAVMAGMRCLGIADPARATLLQGAGAEFVVSDFTRLSVRDLEEWFAAPIKPVSLARGTP